MTFLDIEETNESDSYDFRCYEVSELFSSNPVICLKLECQNSDANADKKFEYYDNTDSVIQCQFDI